MKFMTLPILFSALGIVGTSARKPSGQQQLSAALGAGFEATGIAQIETSLINLAREKSTPDSSTLESIAIIQQYINAMKADVLERASDTQAGLNQSWHNLVNCRLNLTDASSNLSILNATHRDCSDAESTMGSQYLNCLNTCETECSSSQAVCDQYCTVNIPDMPSPSPSPGPGTCHFADTVKGDDEVGTYKEWDSNLIYERWAHYFNGLYSDWTAKRNSCRNQVTTMQNCYQHCASTHGTFYATKKQECTDHQYDLEAAACHENSAVCQAYQGCFGSLTETYQADVDSARASQASWYSEYRGIQRVVCLLGAFNASVVSGADLTAALNTCQSTVFDPCAEERSLCLDIYPSPQMESCNGTYSNNTLRPGSSAWIEAFYTGMPNMTTWEACGASCCASGGPEPPTPSPLPSTNCSLCTNESF
eukprot:TRINITY_DN173_c0_g1_i2.p1 TRINITY_DN173_c0_g1~~TRINITY_DN173_c0_g1_i2.p1  ORF type:complete len:422 (-),score=65.61 TRINITY_DN173_c0_g1_i2:114-1379(-)